MPSQSFGDVFDQLYFSSTSERDKGTKFERFLKRYLEVEPKYADQFSNVWMWQEWPARAGRPDTGIDLVAEDRYTGELTAIQAKFFDPSRPLQKQAIDSFFTELGKAPFTQGMIVSTTDKWSRHAEDALTGQSKPIQRIRLQDFADSTIDWSVFDIDRPEALVKGPGKEPRKYQRDAIEDVKRGFELHDRGKLIMACGTGKTFTSLKLVEELVPVGGSVLFLVPSIALLQQTLNEWTGQADVPLRPFAVCSDATVGRKQNEDVSEHDLGFPASTDPAKLAARFQISTGAETLTVVFSTYQSIDVIHQAQQAGLPDFDLIVCDEAHRTTGISQPGADDSAFVRVHDNAYLQAKKRLYMTATPRIYVEDSKAKAAKDGIVTYSMDDDSTYGPEFHHLGFGKAVEMGHLVDYKVLILAVDEESVATSFQTLLAEDGDMNLDDVARIVGCWNGLSKRGVNGEQLSITDTTPMHRAVAFARNIKESKAVAAQLERVGRELVLDSSRGEASKLKLEAKHVDGTFNVLDRSARLDWLQDEAEPDVCRILTNAKCLTEGVDVPSLDAVLFLNPRNSQVDVVQAVGRVMRKSPTTVKEYGYIILPIAVPASQDPETALGDNKKYKVVWDVLQALRAHDDRFEAMINKLDLDKKANSTIDVIGIGTGRSDDTDHLSGSAVQDGDTSAALFSMVNAAEWENAIFARMVKKVGDRRYWEDWASDVKDIADRQVTRIKTILDGDDHRPAEEFAVFLEGLRGNLNDGISRDDAVDMLVQHLITKPVFDALFEDYDFSTQNPVSRVMDSMLATLDSYNLDSETNSLEEFYRSVRVRADGISTAAGKQQIITELYERFFKLAFPRVAESLGIVYTPIEIVDFILRAVNDALKEHFGASITDEGVHVLDPFTGTGTFIVRLLQSGLISPEDLLRKYTRELHANEILLMAYYIAAINIEATFHALQGEGAKYQPFDGIVLTDTFQMTEDGDALDTLVFTNNSDRVIEQNELDIRVIIGNPPYSVGQTSGNDNNANQKYPTLDASIRTTYADRSTATLKNSLYDSYIRAIRWASNRVLTSENGGIVCYVSNGGYIDGNTADGLRKTLADEFHDIYVYNLRGNARTAGELRRKEKDNVFGAGGRTSIAILLLVKRPGDVTSSTLHYKDIGDYLDRATKLLTVNDATLATLDWQQLTPNAHGDWINHRDPNYEQYPIIAEKGNPRTIFAIHSGGLKTNRDAWVYNSSKAQLEANVSRTIDNYNAEVDRWQAAGRPTPVEAFIDNDGTRISWARSLRNALAKGNKLSLDPNSLRTGLYRPFQKQHTYFAALLNDERGQMPRFFPAQSSETAGFYLVGPGNDKPFSLLATNTPPDLSFWGSGQGQFFARYSYRPTAANVLFEGVERADNITDWVLEEYQRTYGADVTKDDIFSYVYGVLHSIEYRDRYAADLKKALPRILQVAGVDRFSAFVAAGRKLGDLHVGYESLEPYRLEELESTIVPTDEFDRYAVQKMKYGGRAGAWDKTRIVYNAHIDLVGIPEEAQRYMLGSRSALDWILERYQVKTDKASGIVNDPNDWSREHDEPRYIIDLIGRIVTLSLETIKIVDSLPDLGLE